MALKRGFSLIELTVVIGLLSVLTLAISMVMLTSIITSNRVRTTTKVKQAGNYAMGQMQGMLRSSKAITDCDNTDETITFVNPDGGVTQLLSQSDGSHTRIASNSGTYLTPDTTSTTSFGITCEPTESDPTLIKVSFELQDTHTTRATENPILHFETSINLRNE
jgi:prepilin-type N-terminal cleavage/methylation domain-containing protein